MLVIFYFRFYLIFFQQFSYLWMNGYSENGECINSSSYMTLAMSPAIIQKDDSLEIINSLLPYYSIWTESQWRETQLRFFLVPSFIQRSFIVFLGIFILIVSFVITWLGSKHHYKLFNHSLQISPQSSSTSSSQPNIYNHESPSNNDGQRRLQNLNNQNHSSEHNRILIHVTDENDETVRMNNVV